jgi:hypothetical protein
MALNVAQQLFLVFFAIFWGISANAWPRWKPFQWTFVFWSPRIAARVGAAFLLLNIGPIAYFAIVIQRLDRMSATSLLWKMVLAGVLPAFAVFGFYRLWIAVIEQSPKTFYYDAADLKTLHEGLLEGPEPTIDILHLGKSQKWWWSNLFWAATYLTAALGAAWILT